MRDPLARRLVLIVLLLVLAHARVLAQDEASPAAPELEATEAPVDAEPQIPEVVSSYQLLASESDALQICDTFIQRVMAGEYEGAFQGIRPFFPISERRFLKLAEETKKQHGLAQLQFGKPLGQVFVSAEMIKDTVVKYRFLEKFEWDVMYWEFMFYKPQTGWLLNGLGFDDDVQVLFK